MNPKPPRTSKPSAATIADVARHAGVSPMTVSRVVNGEDKVRPGTRAKVQAAVAALHYMPNQAARRLAGSDLFRIGVLYSNPSAGYLSDFLVGLLNQASSSHVQLVVVKCGDDHPEGGSAEEAVGELIANGIDGLILPPPLCDAPQLVELVLRSETPAVAVASGSPDPRLSAVSIDDEAAALAMARHLLALGHQRVGFIVGHPNQSASQRRLAGFKTALQQAGLALPDALVVQGLFNYRSGLDAAERLLAQEPRPTAIFASNDDMAAATVAVAHRLGLDVPGDLTVSGFDDTALATTIWPELTTIHQPIADMARAAVQLLIDNIRERRSGATPTARHVVMAHSLVRRQSDAAPRLRPPVRLAEDAPRPGARARQRS